MRHNKSLFNEPQWLNAQQISGFSIPESMACWLFDPASLTARLIAACKGKFHVEVIEQGWQVPMLNEIHRLGMLRQRRALIRQVYLYCDNTPWVYARTVIPKTTLAGKSKFLANLGNKPLGAVLFADPNMRRDPVEVAQLVKGQAIFEAATSLIKPKPDRIWGRRSVFYLHRKPLLVNEVFLPKISACPKPESNRSLSR